MRVIILGGGLAGLSAGYSLSKGGHKVTVLEAEPKVGGLARSYDEGGFTYDLGPHRFHTEDAAVDSEFRELMGSRFADKERRSRIRLEGRFFDYPLRVGNAVFNMPPATTARIVADYAWAKAKGLLRPSHDDNFEEWVMSRFGRKLYDLYFRVYTEKTWGMSCTSLSADWAAQRISLLSLWDTFVQSLMKGVKGGEGPRTYVSSFHYPLKGGIGSLAEEYAKRIRENGGEVMVGSAVKGIRLAGDRISEVAYEGGKVAVEADDLVFSTIPLTDLIGMCEPSAPKEILDACGGLRFRSIVFVHLMFERERISDDHWIYLPEPKYAANRVSESRNFSEDNAPKGRTVIGAEITCQKGDETWDAGGEDLARRVLEDLADIGLVRREEFIGSSVHRMEHAYPIYGLDYRRDLDAAVGHLKGISNLRFFGRNGLFRYNNMDHSISMGRTAAATVAKGSGEYMKVATEEHWFG